MTRIYKQIKNGSSILEEFIDLKLYENGFEYKGTPYIIKNLKKWEIQPYPCYTIYSFNASPSTIHNGKPLFIKTYNFIEKQIFCIKHGLISKWFNKVIDSIIGGVVGSIITYIFTVLL